MSLLHTFGGLAQKHQTGHYSELPVMTRCNLKSIFCPSHIAGPNASDDILTDFMDAAQMAREEDCYLPEDKRVVSFTVYFFKVCCYTCQLFTCQVSNSVRIAMEISQPRRENLLWYLRRKILKMNQFGFLTL